MAAVAAAAAAGHQQPQQQQLLLSAGKDHKLKLWELGAAGSAQQQQQQQNGTSKKDAHSSSGGTCQPHLVAEYAGHKEAVQAVAADPAGSWCCSGGWDGQLLLWKTGGLGECCSGCML